MLRLKIYEWFEKIRFLKIGPFQREQGIKLAQIGLKLQEPMGNDDRLVSSLRRKTFANKTPVLDDAQFIAPNACIIGDVNLNSYSAVWYGAILRGDKSPIEIGKHCVIQDLATINGQNKVTIGDNVYVGPNSVIEGCQIENQAFIGMGQILNISATVREGSKICANAVIAAGSVIAPNSTIQSFQVWAGNPAQYLRDITPQEKEALDEHLQEQVELGRIHAEENEKSFRQILNDLDQEEDALYADPEDLAVQKLKELGFPIDYEDEDYIEQRVFLKDQGSISEDQMWKKSYDPYEQDIYNFPDSKIIIIGFKVYGENFEYYEQVKQKFEKEDQIPFEFTKERIEPPNQKAWNNKYDL